MTVAKRASGWWYPWIFVGGMGLVIVVNAILVYFALDSWTGLETDHHYRKGLVYNQDLAAAEAQRALGWSAGLTVSATAAEGRAFDVAVRFHDKAAQPLEGLSVRLFAVRPTHEGYDSDVALAPVGPGVYTGRVTLALPGQWDMRVVANRGADAFQSVERINVD